MRKTRAQLEKNEKLCLAPYAMQNTASLGRFHKEENDDFRLPFQRDRDRIVHCKAFRRLQAKTQVFVSGSGDHYRDRLTHTIEVAQIARDVARTLGLNEDLAEAIALAHDLGHPPFGHGGEAALDELMRQFNLNFEHNEQSYRIVTKLEKPYPGFDGLNLTIEVLDGLLKHARSRHLAFIKFKTSPHLEAQVADLADEIAYTNHDIDDGIRANLLTSQQMEQFALWREAKKQILRRYHKKISSTHLKSRIISRMIAIMIHDLCITTNKNIKQLKINNINDIRKHRGKIVTFSPKVRKELKALRRFLMKNFYEHPKINFQIQRGKIIIKNLFLYYAKRAHSLPRPFYNNIKRGGAKEIVIKDYIAGMTDHYAEKCWALIKKRSKIKNR